MAADSMQFQHINIFQIVNSVCLEASIILVTESFYFLSSELKRALNKQTFSLPENTDASRLTLFILN